MERRRAQPRFVAGDVDGFFGIAVDNLIQFLLVMVLCTQELGFSSELVIGTILPACALSVVLGNLFYAFQARRLSKTSERNDVTALPYGINTVSLFAFVFLVMAPVKESASLGGASVEEASRLAWQVGLAACLLSGVIELLGSFVARRVRAVTPRAALLSTLSGIAISFISIDFAMRTFASPLIALLPLGIILTSYFARTRLPFRVPGGAWAVVIGASAAWILAAAGQDSPASAEDIRAVSDVGVHLPIPVVGDLVAGLQSELTFDFFVPVILPMGLFSVLGSLQNIESAEAAGDGYPELPSLAANGIGSIVAAVFGSCFPTTIYIGHPAWKAMGARSGYSVLNGIFFAVIALFGLTSIISALIPLEAGMAIVLWIGIMITAQAFQATPRAHAPAVAMGLFPAIAGWGVLILLGTLGAAGSATNNHELAAQVLAHPQAFTKAGVHIEGLVALSQGFMVTCLVWASVSALLIDRKFLAAAAWTCVGAFFAFFGLVHAGSLSASGAVYDLGFAKGWRWSIGYLLCGAFFTFSHYLMREMQAGGDGDAGRGI